MLLSMLGPNVFAHDIEVENADGVMIYYNYINDGTELMVTYQGYSYNSYDNEYSGDVNIPEKVTYMDGSLKVTCIGEKTFSGCSGLTSIILPNSVTSIGYEAFRGCSGLTSITIPNSVTSIGDQAFYDCSGLPSISIPNSVTSIGDWAFYNCYNLITVNIPNSLTEIGSSVFNSCRGLSSVNIGNNVTRIGKRAFYDCINLNSFSIPNSVLSIGPSAFDNTGWYNNQNDGILCKDNWLLGVKGNKPSGELNIGNGFIGIADYAFSQCGDITSINMPSSMMSIGQSAFYGCSGLTSITFPNSITSIGSSAFRYCSGITAVVLPENISIIQKRTFSDCTSLESITIPASVEYIYQEAFANCTSLEVINAQPTTPPFMYDNSFSDFTVPVIVPLGCAEAYSEAQGWSYFTTIYDGNMYYQLMITTGQHGKATYEGLDIKNASKTFNIKEGSDAAITITADADYQIATVTVNGEDALGSIANGVLTLSNITANKTIKVTFNRSSDHTTITLANAMQTYCPLDDVDFSKVTGLKAYTATGFDHGTLTVSRVLNAPAGTGLLLQGETGTYNVPYASTTGYYINLLHGLTEDTWVEPTDGNQTNFVLGKKNNVLTFYQLSSAGTIAAGKAYLQLPTSVVNEAWGSRVMRIIADDETTGIREVYDLTNGIDAMDADAVYDLCGRKVTGARKGLYIVNGQKVFIR